jgi:uncharacterized protein YodC (DUF2158 family)
MFFLTFFIAFFAQKYIQIAQICALQFLFLIRLHIFVLLLCYKCANMNTPPTTKIQIGDLVQLLSGGAIMVVEDVGVDADTFVCVWHDSRSNVHRRIFRSVVLKKIAAPDEPKAA